MKLLSSGCQLNSRIPLPSKECCGPWYLGAYSDCDEDKLNPESTVANKIFISHAPDCYGLVERQYFDGFTENIGDLLFRQLAIIALQAVNQVGDRTSAAELFESNVPNRIKFLSLFMMLFRHMKNIKRNNDVPPWRTTADLPLAWKRASSCRDREMRECWGECRGREEPEILPRSPRYCPRWPPLLWPPPTDLRFSWQKFSLLHFVLVTIQQKTMAVKNVTLNLCSTRVVVFLQLRS